MLHVCNLSEPVTLKVLLSSPGTPRKTTKCSFALMRTKPIFLNQCFLWAPTTAPHPRGTLQICGDLLWWQRRPVWILCCRSWKDCADRTWMKRSKVIQPEWKRLLWKRPYSGRVSSFRPSPMWVASDAGRVLTCLHEAWGKFLCVARPLCPSPSREALLI